MAATVTQADSRRAEVHQVAAFGNLSVKVTSASQTGPLGRLVAILLDGGTLANRWPYPRATLYSGTGPRLHATEGPCRLVLQDEGPYPCTWGVARCDITVGKSQASIRSGAHL